MPRNKYLFENPRGFANEFFVLSVPPELIPQAEIIIEAYEGDTDGKAYFITRKEAEKITARERQKAREHERAGLNLHQNPVGATSIEPLEEHLHTRRGQKKPF